MRPVYLIHGTEYGRALAEYRRLRGEIAEASGGDPEILRFSGPEAWSEARAYLWQGSWGGIRLVVMEDTPLLGSRPAAAPLRSLIQALGTWPEGSVLLLFSPQAEVSPSLVKAVLEKGEVFTAKPLTVAERRELASRLAREAGWSLPPEVLRYLSQSDLDYDALKNEFTKVFAYTGGETPDMAAVLRLLPQGSGEKVFALADAAFQSGPAAALLKLDALLKQGEAPLLLLSLLARQVRLLYKLKALEGVPEAEIRRELGVPPYLLPALRSQAQGLTLPALREAWELLLQADRRLKRSRDAAITLELLLFRLSALAGF